MGTSTFAKIAMSVHPRGMEPLAAAIQAAMDAAGLKQADVARRTGLSTALISNLVNRRESYGNRPPEIETLQALAKIPGLSQGQINEAVVASMGLVIETDVQDTQSQVRRSVHAVVDKFDDDQLHRVLQVLIAMLD